MRTLLIGAAAAALALTTGVASGQGILHRPVGTVTPVTTTNLTPPSIPLGNHYVCYPVKAEGFKPRQATFRDQFGAWTVTVIRPTHLCTPAEKRANNAVSPMTDPKLHLVCYAVGYNGGVPVRVLVNDQFGAQTLSVSHASTVCLPAGKLVIK